MKSREYRVAPESNYYNYSSSVKAKETLLYLQSVGEFIYEPDYYLERNSFDSFLLEVILDGTVEIENNGVSFHAKANDAVLLDCYKPHRYYSKTGWHAIWIHFDGVTARGYYDWVFEKNGAVFSPWGIRTIQKSIMEIFTMFHSEKSVDEPRIALAITNALVAMMEDTKQARHPNQCTPTIYKVLHYINEHIANKQTNKELAQMASFSEYHFIRMFKKMIGLTPLQYTKTVRMEHAKYLLKTTQLTIGEIGFAVGYESESMFCTTFKSYVGMTPIGYRRDTSNSSA